MSDNLFLVMILKVIEDMFLGKESIMNKQKLGILKYWLRINVFRLGQFGTGEKWNPIKVKLKRKI